MVWFDGLLVVHGSMLFWSHLDVLSALRTVLFSIGAASDCKNMSFPGLSNETTQPPGEMVVVRRGNQSIVF